MAEEDDIVTFFPMSSRAPSTMAKQNTRLRIGNPTADEDPSTLKLAHGSKFLTKESWVKIEEPSYIEWYNLDEWGFDVRVDVGEIGRLWRRVKEQEQEAKEKRLLQAIRSAYCTTIVPLSSTHGAPGTL
jgi:hypothetical protein